MPPKSANPEFQTLLDEIDNFYFAKELEGYDILHHNTALEAAWGGAGKTAESSAHESFSTAVLCTSDGYEEGGVPLSLNIYINKAEDAIDKWIKENKNYITNKQELGDAFREFAKTGICEDINSSLLNNPLISAERKARMMMGDTLIPIPPEEFPLALSLSFQNKVMVHQQRELMKKLEDGSFEKGTREEPTNERKAFEYGLEILCSRLGIAGFTQNRCSCWGLFAGQIENARNPEQSKRFGRKLTNLFLEKDETLEGNLEKEDKTLIEAVKEFNSGRHNGFESESGKVARKLNEKYIGIKRANIKKLGRASLAWSIKKETTNKWKKESEQVEEEIEELRGTFSPFRRILFSIEKAYYDRKAANAFKEERRVATDYEKRYIGNDSKVLLAKQKFETFCIDKGICHGENAQLNKEDLGRFSRLLFNVSKASYDAKLTLGLNEDTIENSKNLWNKTNESISQMVLQNAANLQIAHGINANRCQVTKTMIESKFNVKPVQEQPEVIPQPNVDENAVQSVINAQTNEVPAQQQTQVLQPVIEGETAN